MDHGDRLSSSEALGSDEQDGDDYVQVANEKQHYAAKNDNRLTVNCDDRDHGLVAESNIIRADECTTENRNQVSKKSSHSYGSNSLSRRNKDQRFICSICLDTVSDEPVVTRCGHLYCWACLYPWLEPGILYTEYYATFGVPPPPTIKSTHNGAGSADATSFLRQISHDTPWTSNISHRHQPSNSSGEVWNEQRRCCPVCKAHCTVDSVIPVYIHILSEDRPEECIQIDDHDTSGSFSVPSSLSESASKPLAIPDSFVHLSAEQDLIHTPHGSPISQRTISSSVVDINSFNLGLHQRRRTHSQLEQLPTCTRVSHHSGSGSDDDGDEATSSRDSRWNNTMTNQQANLSMPSTLHDTPIRRNGNNTNGIQNHMPPRPATTTPRMTTNRSNTPATVSHGDTFHHDSSNETFSTSSPFRMALRPHRPPNPMMFPTSEQPQQQPHFFHSHRHHGRLTSMLMEIVDTIDSLAAVSSSTRHGERAWNGNENISTVPTLHRTDGGLGGIGRASEHQYPAAAAPFRYDDAQVGAMREEETSLEMAREFLSRLLLMLACFVVLCLLLF